MSTVGLWSGKNVLKHAYMDSGTMNKPSTSDGGLGFFSTATIDHNLGYRPLVKIHYDPDSNGKIFPTNGQGRVQISNNSPLSAIVPFWLYVDDITTTNITLRTYSSGSLGGTFNYYYRIYIDPTL